MADVQNLIAGDCHRARRDIDLFATADALVGADTLNLYCGYRRRFLHDCAGELRNFLSNHFIGHQCRREFGEQLAFGVVGKRGGAEPNRRLVGLRVSVDMR